MKAEWDRGLIVYTGWAPFGHQAFAFPLLGLPGVMLMHDSVLDLPEDRRRCLKVHERYHWVQWARVTIGSFVALLFVVAATTLPWWTMLAAPYVWHVGYFAFFRRQWEDEADRVQRDCIEGVDGHG